MSDFAIFVMFIGYLCLFLVGIFFCVPLVAMCADWWGMEMTGEDTDDDEAAE